MSARKGFTGVAEQECSRRHQTASCGTTILKRPGNDNGNRKTRMLLFKRLMLGAGSADHVGYVPPVSSRDLAHLRRVADMVVTASRRPVLGCDRNFRQE